MKRTPVATALRTCCAERTRAMQPMQTGAHEFYVGGAGVSFDFIRRPKAEDENCYSHLSSRQSSQLNFLSVEEGHFEAGKWVKDMERNGDETNFSQYVLDGQVIRVRLNPETGMH